MLMISIYLQKCDTMVNQHIARAETYGQSYAYVQRQRGRLMNLGARGSTPGTRVARAHPWMGPLGVGYHARAFLALGA